MNILIVDDNPTNLKLLRAVLEGEGMQVDEATDGMAALAALRQRPGFDAIVSDLAMPRMDGFRFCMEVRRRQRFEKVSFIAYTGSYVGARDEQAILAMGADRFVRKPTSGPALLRIVDEAVQRRRAGGGTRRRQPPIVAQARRHSERLGAKLAEKDIALEHMFARLRRIHGENQIAQARLQQLVELGPAVVCTRRCADGRTTPVMVSENVDRLLGYSEAEALDVTWWQRHLHPEDRARALLVLSDALARGASTAEYRLQHKDGRLRWISDQCRLVRDADGRPFELVSVWTDITARKEAELALRQSESVFRQVIENTDAVVWMTDRATGELHYVSRAYDALWGRPGASLRTDPLDWLNGVHPQDRPRIEAALARPVAGAGEQTYRILRPDGSERWVRDRTFPAQDREDTICRVVGLVEGATDRKRAEVRQAVQHAATVALSECKPFAETARSTLELIGTRLEWSHGVFWTVDRATRALRCAEVWQAKPAAGVQADAARAAACAAGDGLARLVWATREAKWIANFDATEHLRGPCGAGLGLRSAVAFPVVNRGEVLGVVEFFSTRPQAPDLELLAVFADVGAQVGQFLERQQLADQFRQAQKMEALGMLAGGIAHDFNNVLAAITGYGELAQMAAGQTPLRQHLEGVLTGARRATALVRQILTFSRQHEQERRPVQLHDTVQEALRLLRAAASANIELEANLAANSPTVLADPTQLHQVLMNLATNAVHAMRERGGRLTVALESCMVEETTAPTPELRPGRYARLTVSDTGHGMDAATRERIFEPFFTTKPAGEGTGLGLSVVHGIVRAHDGAITVASEPGAGTTFRIYLPAHLGEAEQQVARTAELPRGHGERVLVVDDEPAIADVSTRVLRALGYAVEGTTDPRAALELVAKDPAAFALVLTDQGMPELSGVELAQRVHALRADLPVVLTSGYTATLQRETLRRVGITELLTKPLTVGDLAAAVHRALARGA